MTAVRHDDGAPPFVVRRLDTEHEALVFPGSDCRIEPAHGDEPARQ
ncbi:DUF1918 domain-containing protein [Dactylosporangium sp. NBC_01737]|nr:DUF1918 domain-containing protein [Dactylosporangium sp. NBC_01737]